MNKINTVLLNKILTIKIADIEPTCTPNVDLWIRNEN